MRKTFLIIAASFFILSSCNIFKNDKKESQNDFKSDNNKKLETDFQEQNSYLIAFYNVENLFDTINDPITDDDEFTPSGFKKWNEKRYEKKLNDLSWVLSNIDDNLPTLIGLCEVENRNVVEDLSKNTLLIAGNYKVIHEESPDTRGIDVALMYRTGLFKYYSHSSVPVIVPDAPESKLRNILYVKGAFAESDTFHIFVNHWKSRRGGREETEFKRLATAKILKTEINKIFSKNENANIIIMGDFNDEPYNTGLNKILNATDKKGNTDFDELYNLMYNKAKNDEGTISRNYKWFMLDNMIVSRSLIDDKDFFVEGSTGHIFKPQKILYYNAKANFHVPNKTYGGKNYYGGYSDHLAVYFILRR